MNDELIQRFVTGWDSAVGARIVIALLGGLVTLITGRIVLQRRCTVVAGLLWLLAGLVLLAFAAAPQAIVTFVIETEYVLRLRVIMAGLSVLVLLITLESIRVTRLQERYALLWVATALTILAAAAFPQALNLLRAVMGMQYAEAVGALAFAFLVLVAFHFSISVSSLKASLDKVAQQTAILKARLEELEKQAPPSGQDRKPS